MNTVLNITSVALGGAAGASLRYAVNLLLAGSGRFPLSTLAVNVLGCFIAGLVAGWLAQRVSFSLPLQLFVTVGFLGSFTTFSALSVETLRLVEADQWLTAGLSVVLNLTGALVAVFVGITIARQL